MLKHKIDNKLNRLNQKYPDSNKKVQIKLIAWLVKELFFSWKVNLFENEKKEIVTQENLINKSNGAEINVFIHLCGGVGDIVMGGAFVQALHKFIGTRNHFWISSDQSREAMEGIFRGHRYIKGKYELRKIDIDKISQTCDVRIDLVRFPKVVFWNTEKIKKLSPKFFSLLQKYQEFGKKYFNFSGSEIEPLRNIYSLNNGHTRRTQADLFHLLEMTESSNIFMDLDEKSLPLFKNYAIKLGQYITLQSGVDANYKGKRNIRIWPRPYYNSLIKLIKSEFPNIQIIQLGKLDEKSTLQGIDIDLRGKTNFEELKSVLKFSLLHIDGECGMVHLKHALYGKSAVFFAQTSVDFCGYPENINVKAEGACNHWCEWVTPDWMEKCCRGFKNPPCMYLLTPERFMNEIREYLKSPNHPTLIKTTASIQGDRVINFTSDKNINCSISLINRIEATEDNSSLKYGSILNIPYLDGSLDGIVYDSGAISESCQSFVLQEFLRVLRNNGIVRDVRTGINMKKVFKDQYVEKIL